MGTDSKKEESQSVLDINRPSHGRTYPLSTWNDGGLHDQLATTNSRLRDTPPNSTSRPGLFLAQKIEVGVAARTRKDNGREVSGEIVGVAALVAQRKGEGDLERELGSASDFAVSPRLAKNGD